ncbi:MAG: response regulator transcription factor [Aureispira sp.]|nr:response regulator transcription factor [Aureispira sp.]
MAKKILIVEDEVIIAEDLAGSLEDLGYEVIGPADNASDTLKLIKKNTPDLAILDINLNQPIDGVQIASILRQDYQVPFVFLTAFSDASTLDRVKKTNPYGYIVKPFDEADLQVTITLALDKFEKEQEAQTTPVAPIQSTPSEDTIFIKSDKQEFLKIKLADIQHVEAYDIYSYIFIDGKKQLVSATLKHLEKQINYESLMRIHRSHIVNLDRIEAIKGNRVIVDGQEIPIGKSYRSALMERLKFI